MCDRWLIFCEGAIVILRWWGGDRCSQNLYCYNPLRL